MPKQTADNDPLTYAIIGAAIKVHQALGPGLLESAYQACLCVEMATANLSFSKEVALPITYRDQTLEVGYRMDFLIEKKVVLELKSVEKIQPIHQAQLLTYMRLGSYPKGLLINFNCLRLMDGIERYLI